MSRSLTQILLSAVLGCALLTAQTTTVFAARLLVSNTFASSVDIYDTSGALLQANFIAPGSGGLALAANVVVGPDGNIYVSSNMTSKVIVYDPVNGQPVGVASLPNGTAPSGLAFDTSGRLYVGDQAGNSVYVFDASLAPLPGDTITIATSGATVGGIDFDAAGRLFISSFGTSEVYVYDNGTTSLFASAGLGGLSVPGGIEVGPDGSVYVANIFGNSISKFDSAANPVDGQDGPGFPFITIPLANYPVPNGISFPGNAPTDIIFDTNGDLLIAFQGPTNPNETPHPLGGLLRYSTSGVLLDELAYPIQSASSLALFAEAVPEPSTYTLGLAATMLLAFWGWKRRRGSARRGFE